MKKTAAVLQESVSVFFGKLGQHIERQIGKTVSAMVRPLSLKSAHKLKKCRIRPYLELLILGLHRQFCGVKALDSY